MNKMPNYQHPDLIKQEILTRTIEQDQEAVALQWAKTFHHNDLNNPATNIARLFTACVAKGDFKTRTVNAQSKELQAPSDKLTVIDYLSHGSRIAIDYQSLNPKNRQAFLQYFPAPSKANGIAPRTSTHDIHRGQDGQIKEGKGLMLGIQGMIKEGNFGVNIAIGGDGQQNFYGQKIAANGYSGHFFYYVNKTEELILGGLEQSAPSGKEGESLPDEQNGSDQFNQGHSLIGASDTFTAAGSVYFSDPVYQAKLLIEKNCLPPDKYGAMQVTLNNNNWPEIEKFLKELKESESQSSLKTMLIQKPVTVQEAKQQKILSYISLDFKTYLKRFYTEFVEKSDLTLEQKNKTKELQSNLWANIKNIQNNQQSDNTNTYEKIKQKIEDLKTLEYVPSEYKKSIQDIEKLFELQKKDDPQLSGLIDSNIALQIKYDNLQLDSAELLEKVKTLQQLLENTKLPQNIKEKLVQQLQVQIAELKPIDIKDSIYLLDNINSSSMVEIIIPQKKDVNKIEEGIENAKNLIEKVQQKIIDCLQSNNFNQIYGKNDERLHSGIYDLKKDNIEKSNVPFNKDNTELLSDSSNLYDDHRNEKNLNEKAKLKYDGYLKQIKQISDNCKLDPDTPEWITWEYGLRQFYKLLIFDTFESAGIQTPEGMEVYFAGSLAKKQATEFSDLDAFVVFKNEADEALSKSVFNSLNNLCQRIFDDTRQLYPDPIGINPARLYGTVDSLFEKIKKGENDDGEGIDTEPVVISILTSRPILGEFILGEELRNKIREDEQLGQIYSARKFYDKAIRHFKGPNNTAKNIDIKAHLIRPIDFILMGLREEFDLYSEDGAHLSAPVTFKLLKEGEYLPLVQIELMENIYNQSMDIRFQQHRNARGESDNISQEKVRHLLDGMQKLRDIAYFRMQILNYNDNLSAFKTGLEDYRALIDGDEKKQALYDMGNNILKNVQKIEEKNGTESLDSQSLSNLSQVLSCCTKALDDPKNQTNIYDLVKLSRVVSGQESPTWKALGKGLFTFACLALAVIGLLTAVPSGGSSLLLTAVGTMGLGVMAGTAAALGATGIGLFKYNSKKGLAKSVSDFSSELTKSQELLPK